MVQVCLDSTGTGWHRFDWMVQVCLDGSGTGWHRSGTKGFPTGMVAGRRGFPTPPRTVGRAITSARSTVIAAGVVVSVMLLPY